jgi:hypothetical protein
MRTSARHMGCGAAAFVAVAFTAAIAIPPALAQPANVQALISSAVVAAIGNGAGFTQGRDFGAWLGVRAGRTRRAGAAAECSDAQFVALDRAGIEAAPPQHAGDRPRQQARPHRLGGSRARSLLSAEDRRHLTSN